MVSIHENDVYIERDELFWLGILHTHAKWFCTTCKSDCCLLFSATFGYTSIDFMIKRS